MDGGCVRGVCRPIVGPVVRGVIGTSGPQAWSPSRLTGSYVPIQWSLAGGSAYGTAIDSYEVLRALESYGAYRKPRAGRAGRFDGTNDYATLGGKLTSGAISTLTVCAWVKFDAVTGFTSICSEYNTSANRSWIMAQSSGKLNVIISSDGTNTGTTAKDYSSTTTMTTDVWYHVAFTWSAGTLKLYINGVEETADKTQDPAIASAFDANAHFAIGAYNVIGTATGFTSGSIRDVRPFSVAKSAAEILAIYNQADTPTTIDRTGLLGGYWLNEEDGTTAYDWSGNGHDLTLTNITTGSFHVADTGVDYNPANFLGFTLSGSTVIPRDESDTTKDAAGGTLQYTGKCPHPQVVETPCITTDGAGTVYLDCPHLTGSETVVSSKGTATVTVAAGQLTFDANKTVAEIVLSDGTHYICCEGPGDDNTNRTVYDVSDGANHATITNGTVATIWSARLAGTAQDWFVLHGGRVDANNVAIPGRASGSLAADGNAKNRTAGKHGNPYSRISPNPWDAPELRAIGHTPTTLYAPGDDQQSVSPADTKFRRTDTDGDDRFFAVSTALTDANLTNAEAYVQ